MPRTPRINKNVVSTSARSAARKGTRHATRTQYVKRVDHDAESQQIEEAIAGFCILIGGIALAVLCLLSFA